MVLSLYLFSYLPTCLGVSVSVYFSGGAGSNLTGGVRVETERTQRGILLPKKKQILVSKLADLARVLPKRIAHESCWHKPVSRAAVC